MRMQSTRSRLAGALGATTLAALAASTSLLGPPACSRAAAVPNQTAADGSASRDSIRFDPSSPQLRFVKVETVEASRQGALVAVTARVAFDEDHTQRVASPLDGRATAILVKPGDKVQPGQPVVTLSSPQVGQLQSDAQKAQQDLSLAKKTSDRLHRLKEDGAVSEKEVVQADADLEKAKSDAARSTASLRALGVSPAEPAVTVALRAQVGGTVVERNVLVGQEVRADAVSPLVTITNLETVWVVGDVYEQDLSAFRDGQPVVVKVPAYPSDTFTGIVGHVGDVVDPATRTVKLRCVVPNRDGRLKPEMFARIEVAEDATSDKAVLVIPAKAVLTEAEHARVIVAGSDGTFRLRVVEIGPENEGRVRVLDGLKAGERVVTDGAIFVKQEIDSQ